MNEDNREGLVVVAEVYDPIEAELIKSLLESSGIRTIIHLKTHGSIAGIGESYGKIPIYVPESEAEEAEILLSENQDQEEDDSKDRNEEGRSEWADHVEKKHRALTKYLSWFWFGISLFFTILAFSMPNATDEEATFKMIFFGLAILAFVIMLRGVSEPKERK